MANLLGAFRYGRSSPMLLSAGFPRLGATGATGLSSLLSERLVSESIKRFDFPLGHPPMTDPDLRARCSSRQDAGPRSACLVLQRPPPTACRLRRRQGRLDALARDGVDYVMVDCFRRFPMRRIGGTPHLPPCARRSGSGRPHHRLRQGCTCFPPLPKTCRRTPSPTYPHASGRGPRCSIRTVSSGRHGATSPSSGRDRIPCSPSICSTRGSPGGPRTRREAVMAEGLAPGLRRAIGRPAAGHHHGPDTEIVERAQKGHGALNAARRQSGCFRRCPRAYRRAVFRRLVVAGGETSGFRWSRRWACAALRRAGIGTRQRLLRRRCAAAPFAVSQTGLKLGADGHSLCAPSRAIAPHARQQDRQT